MLREIDIHELNAPSILKWISAENWKALKIYSSLLVDVKVAGTKVNKGGVLTVILESEKFKNEKSIKVEELLSVVITEPPEEMITGYDCVELGTNKIFDSVTAHHLNIKTSGEVFPYTIVNDDKVYLKGKQVLTAVDGTRTIMVKEEIEKRY